MCILFMYASKNSFTAGGGNKTIITPSLKLVIASNRDETYTRPTKKAQFWESDPHILAGQDVEEGGTWLGISKERGKLAILLNIMGKAPEQKKLSRGDLVTGFLRSPPGLRGWTYCNNLHTDESLDIRKNFGRFNLLTIDLKETTESHENPENNELSWSDPLQERMGPGPGALELTYLSNVNEEGPRRLAADDGQIYAFGNSLHDKPFCKVADGCRDFEQLIKKYTNNTVTAALKDEMVEDIVQFLNSTDKHFPDPQMQEQAKETRVPPQLLPELSSIFVKSKVMNYGTRTHTVLIVDSNNSVDFHEWTLQDPIDCDNPQWIQSKYEFTIS